MESRNQLMTWVNILPCYIRIGSQFDLEIFPVANEIAVQSLTPLDVSKALPCVFYSQL